MRRTRSATASQVYDAATGRLRTLDSAKARYRGLTWRRDGDDLAVLREIAKDDDEEKDEGDEKKEEDAKPKKGDEPSHTALAWRNVGGDDGTAFAFDPREAKGFPKNARVVANGLRWSEAGDALFCRIKERPEDYPARRAEPGSLRADLDEPAGVEVWHPKDIDIIPRQKVTLSRDRDRSDLAAVWLEGGSFVRLGDELTESVSLVRGERWAIGRDNTPYETEKRFGPTVVDVYRIDTRTGEKKKILSRRKFVYGSSPDGRFITYMDDDGRLWSYELATDEKRNLTSGLDGDFVNDERNVLTDENPGYGVAGWSEDGARVLVNSRWDLWSIAVDGSGAERLTAGASDRIRHRRVSVDPDPRKRGIVDFGRPMLISLYGDRTKKSGYARRQPGGETQRLAWRDKAIGRLTKAEDADVWAFVEQAFDDAPDVFVSDGSFGQAHRVSETNAQLKDYLWGRAELVDYQNAHGAHLQGALFYPADYDPKKRYPMITYIYEMRSQVLNQWSAPSERNAYNTTVFTQQGYFVFQPDIVYRAQNPGLSALECVVPAVQKVLERSDIDPKKVGLVGHSWGAYQTAFLVTHSDVFAAGHRRRAAHQHDQHVDEHLLEQRPDRHVDLPREPGSDGPAVLEGPRHLRRQLTDLRDREHEDAAARRVWRRGRRGRLAAGRRDVQRRAFGAEAARDARLPGGEPRLAQETQPGRLPPPHPRVVRPLLAG